MSGKRQKRRRQGAPMPATGAGLLRFFEEDTPGIHVKPGIVVIFAVVLIIGSIIVQFSI
jgi:preprotein translocase subunit Sec61beta